MKFHAIAAAVAFSVLLSGCGSSDSQAQPVPPPSAPIKPAAQLDQQPPPDRRRQSVAIEDEPKRDYSLVTSFSSPQPSGTRVPFNEFRFTVPAGKTYIALVETVKRDGARDIVLFNVANAQGKAVADEFFYVEPNGKTTAYYYFLPAGEALITTPYGCPSKCNVYEVGGKVDPDRMPWGFLDAPFVEQYFAELAKVQDQRYRNQQDRKTDEMYDEYTRRRNAAEQRANEPRLRPNLGGGMIGAD